MSDVLTCRECHSPLPSGGLEGFCSRCLLNLALEPTLPRHSSGRAPEFCGAVPKYLGDYEILEQIGEGGMGVVFKARHLRLDRIDALKMIRSGSLASAAELERFRTEAQAAAKVRHRNVVAVHQVGQEAGQVFFSMDYIEGKSLAEATASKPLSPPRAAAYVKTIAEAVQYAHECGVLHRDLKPANILIDSDDQPRITDFGLARQMGYHSDVSRSGDALGTPGYMPPEQAAGRRAEISAVSDVYSLGALLYELLTSRPPFQADTVTETLRQVLETEPAAPRLLNPAVPADLETICLKCLSKEPARRYSSARELAAELGRFINHEPIRARPIGRGERTWRWCRRHPGLAALVLGASALLLLVSISSMAVTRLLETRLREEALMSNRYAAQHAAETIRFTLTQLSRRLINSAQSSELKFALSSATPDRAPQSELQDMLEKFALSPVQSSNQKQKTWLLDGNGVLLSVWPFERHEDTNILDKDFSYREYFHGAKRRSPGKVHWSGVFKAVQDRRWRCALSTPVYDGTNFLGVLATSISLSPDFGSETLNDERYKAALVGPHEEAPESATRSRPDSYYIFAHPALRGDEPAVVLPRQQHPEFVTDSARPVLDESPRKQSSIKDDYYDPVSELNSAYKGRWLAASAPVGNSDWAVIVQQKYEHSIEPSRRLLFQLGLWTATAFALLLLLFGILGVSRYLTGRRVVK